MPIYEYECDNGHRVERIRSISSRHDSLTCEECQAVMTLAISKPHCMPDGMYSYAPNLGTEAAFERRREAIKSGEKVIKKSVD